MLWKCGCVLGLQLYGLGLALGVVALLTSLGILSRSKEFNLLTYKYDVITGHHHHHHHHQYF